MKTSYLYDSGGKRQYPEDEMMFSPDEHGGIFGVLDGVSFYAPDDGPRLFDGLTQGQLAVRIVKRTFFYCRQTDPVGETLILANKGLGLIGKSNGLKLEEPELLPGADFAIAQIMGKTILLVWGGDCGAVWLNKDGSYDGTINRAYSHELWVEETFAKIKAKHNGNLNLAWEEWLPLRREHVRKHQNKPGGWSTLNGRPEFANSWAKTNLSVNNLRIMILFTDGFVSFKDTENPEKLSEKLIGIYKGRGLSAILKSTRQAQTEHLPRSHEAICPEATAIAIEF